MFNHARLLAVWLAFLSSLSACTMVGTRSAGPDLDEDEMERCDPSQVACLFRQQQALSRIRMAPRMSAISQGDSSHQAFNFLMKQKQNRMGSEGDYDGLSGRSSGVFGARSERWRSPYASPRSLLDQDPTGDYSTFSRGSGASTGSAGSFVSGSRTSQ